MSKDPDCPCGSGEAYDACCGPVVRNERPADTAEELMRSRYSAYVLGDVDHVFRSWHPAHRPDGLDELPHVAWTGLEILDTEDGGPADDYGIVEFRARHEGGALHERSRFLRRAGRWVYVDGEIFPDRGSGPPVADRRRPAHPDPMGEREDFLAWVRGPLQDAELALHQGDPEPRRALWSRTEPVSVLGAWRNAIGLEEVDELFTRLGESFSDCTSFGLEVLAYDVIGDVAWTAGLEHTSASVGGEPRAYTLRATQVYRREAGQWRVAHRHGDTVEE